MNRSANRGHGQKSAPPRRRRRDLETRQLEDFLAVLAHGTLGDAARGLNTSQPSLTTSIRALEQALGGELFLRSPHGMKPTAFGRAFEARARVIVGEIDRAEREADEFLEVKRGRVVLGSRPFFVNSIFPEIFHRFRGDYPGIDVTVVAGKGSDLVAGVARGELDYSFHPAGDWIPSADLDYEVLLPELRIHIVCGRDNPLAARRDVSLREIAAAPWVLPSASVNAVSRLNALLASAGLPPIKPVLECDSAFVSRYFFGSSDMLSILFDILIRDELKKREIKIVRLSGMPWRSDVRVIFRRHGQIHPAAAKLLDVARKVCAEYQRELLMYDPRAGIATPPARSPEKPKGAAAAIAVPRRSPVP